MISIATTITRKVIQLYLKCTSICRIRNINVNVSAMMTCDRPRIARCLFFFARTIMPKIAACDNAHNAAAHKNEPGFVPGAGCEADRKISDHDKQRDCDAGEHSCADAGHCALYVVQTVFKNRRACL